MLLLKLDRLLTSFIPLTDPAAVKLNNKDVRQNLRRADKSSVSIDEMRLWSPTFLPDPKTKKQIEDGLEAWKNGRKGRQIASVR